MRNPPPSDREVKLGSTIRQGYPNNEVHTTKYTLVNFVPKILFEQLQRGVNLYFLGSCALMSIGYNTSLYIGTIKAFSTLAVLVLMMSISAIVSLIDDFNRRQADKIMNSQLTTKIEDRGGTKQIAWRDVQVGDLLKINEGEEVPADAILLASSGYQGYSYVSTSSLDGETSLKLQTSAKETCDINKVDNIREELRKKGDLTVTAEPPNPSIHTFNGKLRLGGGKDAAPLSKSQLLLRGSKLQNTTWCVAIVIYTGFDTRIMKNTTKTPSKLSHLESVNNKAMVVTAACQALIALVSDIMHCLTEGEFLSYWYIFPTGEPVYITLPAIIAWWFSFFTLYSNMVPVSLYSTMEIVNFFQARSIKQDKDMEGEDPLDFSKKQAAVRSTNLCQEIGQVTHIFSDKTGTLTKNKMTSKAFSISDRGGTPKVYTLTKEEDRSQLKNDSRDRNSASRFMEVLSVAHSVMVTTDKQGKQKFMAESPDEVALVDTAKTYGWEFKERKGEEVFIMQEGRQKKYKILAENAFSSKRSRMSVLVESEKGECWLFVKGADTVMFEMTQNEKENKAKFQPSLDVFAKEGLRTLLVGVKEISAAQKNNFLGLYDKAKLDMHKREALLEQAAESIEKDITLIGVTAIEDELQDNVGDTIKDLRKAGIKVWVLTGDKLETAKTIGFSTKVLTPNMDIEVIHEDMKVDEVKKKLEQITEGHVKKEEEFELAKERSKAVKTSQPQSIEIDVKQVGLMITGKALADVVVKSPDIKQSFLTATNACSVVIACRVAPRQKAELVTMVREEKKGKKFMEADKEKRVTLAIGDGANDVPMIQAAQVGVGIYGREGYQAVNSADFALGQFQFLSRLVLIQGRWNYRRTCKFVLFTFWRCVVQVLLCFFFTFCCGFSATILFHDNIRLSFNVVLAPVICAVGVFDRDVSASFVKDNPKFYHPGMTDADLNPWRMFQQLLSALAHAVFIWSVMFFAFPGLDFLQAGDLYTFGTAVWTILILDCQIRGAFLTITWTPWNLLALIGSSLMYIFMLMTFCKSKSTMLHGTFDFVFGNAIFYVACFAACMMGVCFDLLIESARIKFYAEEVDVKLMEHIRENEKKSNGLTEHAPGFDFKRDNSNQPVKYLRHYVYESNFGFIGPQTLPHFQLFHTDRTGWKPSFFLALCFFVLGGVWMYFAGSVASEVSIKYSDTCARNQPCLQTVTIPEDMPAPIMVSYKIDPFFQNYLVYANSYSMMELMGLNATDKDLAQCQLSPTSLNNTDGLEYVPCGLVAASVFNDTFRFVDPEIVLNSTGIARTEEVTSLFNNPEDYGDNPNKIWLYQRYPPEVISKEEGVRSEHFAVWNRVSAMGHAQKPLGRLNTNLTKGQTLTIEITDRFDPGPNASKTLVFTHLTLLGGVDNRLGILLIVMGLLIAAAGVFEKTYTPKAREEGFDEVVGRHRSDTGLQQPLLPSGST